MMKYFSLIAGLCITFVLSAAAMFLAQTHIATQWHISALTLAIVLGIVCGNSIYPMIEARVKTGVLFAKGFCCVVGLCYLAFV